MEETSEPFPTLLPLTHLVLSLLLYTATRDGRALSAFNSLAYADESYETVKEELQVLRKWLLLHGRENVE